MIDATSFLYGLFGSTGEEYETDLGGVAVIVAPATSSTTDAMPVAELPTATAPGPAVDAQVVPICPATDDDLLDDVPFTSVQEDWDNAVDLPPCPICGSLEQWETAAGDQYGIAPGRWRCMACDGDAFKRSRKLADDAQRLRERYAKRKTTLHDRRCCVPVAPVDTLSPPA